MKKIITAFVFCFLCGKCFSQAGEWVWIKGDSIPNQPGSYGVQGVPSPTNNPPSLYEPCEWTDLNGNFWLFGGIGYGGRYGDLWKYNPLSNRWTWMKGSGIPDDLGHYGIQGVPSINNYPSARGFAMTSWVDTSGNLWMFGGNIAMGYDLNDLWRYNILTNEWTWMKGSNTANQIGNYGVQGIPGINNTPGAREECVSAWTDDQNNFWLFGGMNSVGSHFNDMWKFDISLNQWSWMKGTALLNQPGIYGTLGLENSANIPSSRNAYSHWKDGLGQLWFFSGYYLPIDNYFNDLWKYNPITNNWEWMGGDSIAYSSGIYGIKCVPSSANIPGARFENRASWKDQQGNFWLLGGGEFGSFYYLWNDLWKYCVHSNKWIWVSNDSIANPIGYWGTKGIASPLNKPNGRAGSVGWSNGGDHLYFFGGYGNTTTFPQKYNDLWKYTIDTTCGVCPATTAIIENNFTNELLVFPNPTNSSLTISFSSSEKQTVELRIYNTLGEVQLSESFKTFGKFADGKFEKEINVDKWSEGIYFFQVKTKEGVMNRKIIVSHP